jgi:hypothetical protein
MQLIFEHGTTLTAQFRVESSADDLRAIFSGDKHCRMKRSATIARSVAASGTSQFRDEIIAVKSGGNSLSAVTAPGHFRKDFNTFIHLHILPLFYPFNIPSFPAYFKTEPHLQYKNPRKKITGGIFHIVKAEIQR